ncbi:M23 family metallopeptidase [Sporosarcina sp. HYO08]|uniref:M23 family metallopeptidase n=1 Tax=Sporosarcina sp. HYO08 TaxID=1759557 RepID=UPI000793BA1E|nr:M23 family metallopeptidase [Sporosarcina sp. HYO08]KXH87075.1 peptidase M23 [Sporosarcina sp. HYO08]
MRHLFGIPIYLLAWTFLFYTVVSANEKKPEEDLMDERMSLYVQFESPQVPWFHLAAVDQYERNIQQVRNDLPKSEGSIAIQFPADYWVGPLNPDRTDTSIESIAFFNGYGLDGNGDRLADATHPEDILHTMATFLGEHDSFESALMAYYDKEETVNQIVTIAKLYEQFKTIALDEHAFPIPVQHHYSYRSTWGASRGWGGRRIHEGTDLFAGYGTPIQSTSYGVIEIMGWNEFGGWRVGIRDNHNSYHYFAHLSSFNKDLKEGDVVAPRTIIGYVGSSGYGKEGTSGRFPPHLHYGIYKYNGRTEWAFDPYPALRSWEREDRLNHRK